MQNVKVMMINQALLDFRFNESNETCLFLLLMHLIISVMTLIYLCRFFIVLSTVNASNKQINQSNDTNPP